MARWLAFMLPAAEPPPSSLARRIAAAAAACRLFTSAVFSCAKQTECLNSVAVLGIYRALENAQRHSMPWHERLRLHLQAGVVSSVSWGSACALLTVQYRTSHRLGLYQRYLELQDQVVY